MDVSINVTYMGSKLVTDRGKPKLVMAKIFTLYGTKVNGVEYNMQDLKISDELSKLIEERMRTNPNELIKVIINLDENAELVKVTRSLSNAGLDVESTIPGPVPIVAGAVAAINIPELAKNSKVKKIEFDGKTYALG